MMGSRPDLLLLIGLALGFSTVHPAWAASSAPCQITGPPPPMPVLEMQSFVKGLSDPVGLVHAGDGSGRLFVVEQRGTIRIIKFVGAQHAAPLLVKKPFLDIRGRVSSGGEMGLLGLAFHPNFITNGRFFVNYTTRTGGLHTVISEFKVRRPSDEADPKSERILLTMAQPYSNHNGGDIHFGPDGKLYIGTGDGGSGNDPHGNGQKLSTLLGKMLRIDLDRSDGRKAYAVPSDNPFVGRSGAAPEVWAYGLRNPWRFSFDPVTGWLYAGDVGQNAREEIDVIEKGKNYGWNIMEGTICTPGVNPDCDKTGLELPILDYPRSDGTVVIGGRVYRGSSITGLCGVYLYADYGSGRVWGIRYDGKSVTNRQTLLETARPISSLGEDEERELYLADHRGEVLKIVAPLTKR